MHDTRLHTEPDEFVRRSRPLTEFDFMEWITSDSTGDTYRFLDPSDVPLPRVREILDEIELTKDNLEFDVTLYISNDLYE